MERKEIISQMVGQCFPTASEFGNRLRRHWIARAVESLPTELALSELAKLAVDFVAAGLLEYVGHEDKSVLKDARPELLLMRLDDYHLLVRIDTAGPSCTLGIAAMVGTWGTLQFVDRNIELEELQGLPVSYWKLLVAARQPIARV